ncbi:MAG: hypothetical protein M2R45_02140 [Verrucomicrobia subdivision 3 bacterium]|nr:hypothetical protein [Limisphaerales bacterium]MCS1413717.1 hypothetical protein [Limisphaerales bacterium]
MVGLQRFPLEGKEERYWGGEASEKGFRKLRLQLSTLEKQPEKSQRCLIHP